MYSTFIGLSFDWV